MSNYSCLFCGTQNLDKGEVMWDDEISEHASICFPCAMTKTALKKYIIKKKLKSFLREWNAKHGTTFSELGNGAEKK